MYRVIPAAAVAALLVLGGAHTTSAEGLLDRFIGALSSTGDTGFWQGAWGRDGETPVITVSGASVSYQGSNRQSYAVSTVAIGGGKVTFQVGQTLVALTRRVDNNVEMVSTVGEHSSGAILLCKSEARHCP
jgi:hypothetical protein